MLHKPIALITGASGGIGSGIAYALNNSGYVLALQYHRNKDSILTCVNGFPSDAEYMAISCDLTDQNQVDKLINSVHKNLGRISVLINCAGIAYPQSLYCDTTDKDLKDLFDIDVFAPMRLSRLVLDDLRENQGSIINISSIWGISGASCEVIYSAAKAALIGFTKALAKELAPSHVTVNAVAPGFIPTAMNKHLSDRDAEMFREATPLQCFGKPEDIARAVLYLIQSPFVTGQVLAVDGGIIM